MKVQEKSSLQSSPGAAGEAEELKVDVPKNTEGKDKTQKRLNTKSLRAIGNLNHLKVSRNTAEIYYTQKTGAAHRQH